MLALLLLAHISVVFGRNFSALCVPCDPGSHSTAACGNRSDTSACNDGYCMDGFNCTECVPGTMQPNPQRPSCDPCGRGYWTNETGATACSACGPGFYCPKDINPTLLPCPSGTICPAARMAKPTDCPAGYYCPYEKMLVGIICPAGSSCPSGASVPVICPIDTKCPQGSPFPESCPALFGSPARSSSCSASTAFWVVLAFTIAILIVIAAILYFRITENPESAQAQIDKEVSGLIPKPQGPSYSGL